MRWLTIRASMRMASWFAERAVAHRCAPRFATKRQHWRASQAEMPPEAAPVLEFDPARRACGTIVVVSCRTFQTCTEVSPVPVGVATTP